MTGGSKLRTSPHSPPSGPDKEDTTTVGAANAAPDTSTVEATSQRAGPTEQLPAAVSPVLETNLDQEIYLTILEENLKILTVYHVGLLKLNCQCHTVFRYRFR